MAAACLTAAAAGLWAAGSGCGNADALADRVVTDSAGVSVIALADRAWNDRQAWTVEPTVVRSLGTEDMPAETMFGRIAAAVGWADGRIAVADASVPAIRMFDSTGAQVWQFGRRGRGPEEFGSIEAMWANDDGSLAVIDLMQHRGTIIGPTGEFGRTFTIAPAPQPLLTALPTSDGRFVFRTRNILRQTSAPEVLRDTMWVFRYSADGERETAVTQIPGVMSYGLGMLKTSVVPFSPEPSFAVRRSDVIVSQGERYEYRVHALDGSLRRIVRLDRSPEEVRQRDVAAWKDRYIGLINTLGPRRESVLRDLDRLLSEVPIPETRPTFTGIVIDAHGYAWFSHAPSPPSEHASSWSVFDRDDHYVGDVAVPAGLTVLAIGDGLIIGSASDNGVPVVRVHRLLRYESLLRGGTKR